MYVLDNDIYTLYFTRESPQPHLERRILATPAEDLYISIVTAEESIRGALALVKKYSTTPRVAESYQFLRKILISLEQYQILGFDEAAYEQFQAIPIEIRRAIGTRDSRIAASALARGFTVITRNTQDIEQVPGIRCEDWTKP